ncbi:MAG: hypothetical protein N3F65_02350 [Nitrososphaeria archaeon]|nr:hypothetical protein [Aigarchaeota archaeon]MCX8187434.1 hypothetical protein [Nitrososphaeria archaeon]MDW8021106.1 hypothetical protein [Nitrososphaerota archaeon]
MKVTIRHGDTEVEFEGEHEEVWMSINRYLSEAFPPLEVVKKLTGAIDIMDLAKKLEGFVEIKEGRINILKDVDAKKKILLCLTAAHVGKALSLFEKDKLTPKEIAAYTGLDERIARARLSELRKAGLVIKYDEGLYGFTPASLEEIFR